ncbi:DUF1501 domain-containing protein [Candidatus Poribacteria bacterium]|nr:DUF1501 domain-containing protein [Candidatus Poribacteria bacterium]MYB65721.1 DUF1501 domain-containing protein [Candidatus Poribacteria bacterium]
MPRKDCINTDCEGFYRRDLIKAGVLGFFGFGLTDFFRLKAFAEPTAKEGTAKSVILVWLGGGPSHLDMWDLKPNAPEEIRGSFKPISTNVTGIQISEHMPRLAKQADKLCIIRSMTSPEAAHERGTHYMITGYQPLPGFAVPGHGAVVAKLKEQRSALPPYIAVPSPVAYAGGGFLGASLAPFSPDGNPASDNFKVRDLAPPKDVTYERVQERKDLRNAVDNAFKKYEAGNPKVEAMDKFYKSAYNLMSSEDARGAFDLSKEPKQMRDAYRRDTFGQSCLLARRLVEAGVNFVTVSNGGWDNHNNIFSSLRGKLRTFDHTMSTLIGDLDQRGLLDSTLVLAMGEFGRTPVINGSGGRDHHPRVFSIMLAGGGVQGGQVVGASDPFGIEPAETPVKPEDLSATIYQSLGIDYNQSIESPDGVRIVLSRGGRPIRGVLA